MVMELASEAESAAQPAPHMQPPPLIGNTGEQGKFILPVGNPGAAGKGEAYDDFNFPGATWTLSAHEGPAIASAVPRKLWHSSPGSAGG